jgi:hypothetical protein
VAVKPLEFREERGLGKIAVDDPHGIVGIQGRDQGVPGFGDGLHVPGGHEAGGADQRECLVASVQNFLRSLVFLFSTTVVIFRPENRNHPILRT